MLPPLQFSNRLQVCAEGQEYPEAFEEWFADASWNVHKQNNHKLEKAVFRVEHWLSEYFEGRMDKTSLSSRLAELAAAIRSFEEVRIGLKESESNAPFVDIDEGSTMTKG